MYFKDKRFRGKHQWAIILLSTDSFRKRFCSAILCPRLKPPETFFFLFFLANRKLKKVVLPNFFNRDLLPQFISKNKNMKCKKNIYTALL